MENEIIKSETGYVKAPCAICCYDKGCDTCEYYHKKEQDVDLDKMLSGYLGHYAYENGGEYPSASEIANHFYELGLNTKANVPKIRGWVARDRDGALFLHEKYPKRIKEEMELDGAIHFWGNGGIRHYLDRSLFPDLKWEDEPIEVELTISRVSK